MSRCFFCVFFSTGLLFGCLSSGGKAWASGTRSYTEEGVASWYGGKFQGRQTANGEIFDTNKFTAAHKTLPFNTIVTVINLENNRRVEVRINDRGPFVGGRIIDLTWAAANMIGMVGSGTARVRLVAENLEVASEKLVVLQLASYRQRSGAALLARKLQENGFRPVIESRGGYFQVVLAGIPRRELDALLPILADLGLTDPLVRQQRS